MKQRNLNPKLLYPICVFVLDLQFVPKNTLLYKQKKKKKKKSFCLINIIFQICLGGKFLVRELLKKCLP